jgi:GAF domain-containing protein
MSLETLLRYKSPVLEMALQQGPTVGSEFFVDRDGAKFQKVVDFMRDGPEKFCVPQDPSERAELRHEASCLELSDLVACIDRAEQQKQKQQRAAAQQLPLSAKKDAAAENQTVPLRRRVSESNEIPTSTSGAPLSDTDFERFDRITTAVAAILNVPVCLVASQTDACSSMAPGGHSVVTVEDAHKDPHYKKDPLVVNGHNIRFFTGCPLIGSHGTRYGVLCAMDTVPRKLTALQAQVLVNFAQLTVQEFEREALLSTKPEPNQRRSNASSFNFEVGYLREWRMRKALREAVVLVWAPRDSSDWPVLYGNEAFTEMTGLSVKPGGGRFPDASITDENQVDVKNNLRDLVKVNSGFSHVKRLSQQSGAFSVRATLKGRNGRSRLNVSCHFNPAGLPIDANAAVIAANPRGKVSENQAPARFRAPNGVSEGSVYFVTLLVEKPGEDILSSLLVGRREKEEDDRDFNADEEEDLDGY